MATTRRPRSVPSGFLTQDFGRTATAQQIHALEGTAGNRATTLVVQRAASDLRWGSSGPDVVRLQHLLNDKARLLPLRATGSFDHQTRAAVLAIQHHHLLEQDGVVGPNTWHALGVADPRPVLREGSSGSHVAELRTLLSHHGVELFLDPDGQYGSLTYALTKAYQARSSLPAYGVVTPATWASLGAAPVDQDKLNQPEIAADEKVATRYMLRQMSAANRDSGLDHGVWYPDRYYELVMGDPATTSLWKPGYIDGHAPEELFDQVGYMDFALKSGKSASEGIRAWLDGLTIAECLTTVVAIQWDTVRAMVGKAVFDRLFGSDDPIVDGSVASEKRLRIRNGWALPVKPGEEPQSLPLKELLRQPATGKGTLGHRPAEPGARYYFGNHPKFKHKHPDQTNNLVGENAMFLGEQTVGGVTVQLWEGLGMSAVTEEQILDVLAEAWNAPRTTEDYEFIVKNSLGFERYEEVKGTKASPQDLYRDYLAEMREHFREDKDPDLSATLTATDLDGMGSARDEVTGRTRTPGFHPDSGVTLDVEKVKKLRAETL